MKLALAVLLGLGLRLSAAEPSFDAASVRVNHSGVQKRGDFRFAPGRFTATNLNLRAIILIAYDIKDYQLAGSPDWVTTETFDVTAVAAGPSETPELRQMLQTLLKD